MSDVPDIHAVHPRVRTLRQLGVLDAAREPVFDAITLAAAELCSAPISVVSLSDAGRQWFKSNISLAGIEECWRELAFCEQAISEDGVWEVSDACLDARLAEKPFVTGPPHVRFYAGAPIVITSGNRIGAVCVIDRRVRQLSDAERATLQSLALIASAWLTERGRHAAVTQELEASESRLGDIVDDQIALISQARRDGLRKGPSSILIAEDEPDVALGLKMQLEALSYQVVGIARTADQTVEMARQFRPSLTLMDIGLAGDGDSDWAAELLRRETETPVVFLATLGDHADVTEAARAAAYGYVTKPIGLKELHAGIEIALWKAHMGRQLRETDRWFASTLRCVLDGVVVIDAGARVRFMNTAAERLLGWTSEEAGGKLVGEVVRFEGEGRATQSLALRALREDRVVGVRYARLLSCRQGPSTRIDESAGPIDDGNGQRLGAVLVLRDAGQRLAQQARLQASEERFRTAFELAPLGMALVSLEGNFLQVNDALCRLFDCTADWLLQRSQASVGYAEDLAHEEARLAELQSDRRAVTRFEKRYVRAHTGMPFWVLVNASMLTEGDEPSCYLYQVHDLTAQKAASAQLAELAAERIKREASELANLDNQRVLSRISHEIRTPLNAVLGFAEMLKLQQPGSQASTKNYCDHILSAGKHLLALVEDVLDLQQVNSGRMRLQLARVALDEALPAAMQLLLPMATARDVRMHPSIEPGLALSVDETRLRQILLNLGSNAIKYSVRGGAVYFRAERSASARVRISIEDNGIGMSPAQLEHLFEPFNRLGRDMTDIPGVGLGLVITRQLVEQMEGTIDVANRPEGGTVVTLDFADTQ